MKLTSTFIELISFIALCISFYLLPSCSNSNKTDIANSRNGSKITTIENVSDSIILPEFDSLSVVKDSLCLDTNKIETKELPPYVGKVLAPEVVEIVNPYLRAFLSSYFVPLMKATYENKTPYYKKSIAVLRKYYLDDSYMPKESRVGYPNYALSLNISMMSNEIAKAIYNGNIKFSFIDGVPFMFENLHDTNYICSTGQRYNWKTWSIDDYYFYSLIIDDDDDYFYFAVYPEAVYFLGYSISGDIGNINTDYQGIKQIKSYLPDIVSPGKFLNETAKLTSASDSTSEITTKSDSISDISPE